VDSWSRQESLGVLEEEDWMPYASHGNVQFDLSGHDESAAEPFGYSFVETVALRSRVEEPARRVKMHEFFDLSINDKIARINQLIRDLRA